MMIRFEWGKRDDDDYHTSREKEESRNYKEGRGMKKRKKEGRKGEDYHASSILTSSSRGCRKT